MAASSQVVRFDWSNAGATGITAAARNKSSCGAGLEMGKANAMVPPLSEKYPQWFTGTLVRKGD
jgi:hypothetical protein